MKYVLSIGLISCGVLSVYFSKHFLLSKEKRYLENHLFALACISSAIWSFGFGGLMLQTDTQTAYLWRAFGMIGTFGYLIDVYKRQNHSCLQDKNSDLSKRTYIQQKESIMPVSYTHLYRFLLLLFQ